MLATTAVDAGSAESAVTYETQQHGEPSLRSARGQPARDTQHTHHFKHHFGLTSVSLDIRLVDCDQPMGKLDDIH